jgi:hypothetical protein
MSFTGCNQNANGAKPKRQLNKVEEISAPKEEKESNVQNEPNVQIDPNSHIDPKKEVPSALLKQALAYYRANFSKIKNKDILAIIDFSQHNSSERFYLIDMVTGAVDRFLVAHGKNSDKNYDGFATEFSNIPDSLMSSQGFYFTAESYNGKHGLSLRLDGLSKTNSNARMRDIVIHGADYVNQSARILGRSWGCPAVEQRFIKEIVVRIKGGALLYAK